MRKIEQRMCEAVAASRTMRESNTEVEIFGGETTVYLHGNAIYRVLGGVKYFTLAGWDTSTTRSRLRALGVELTSKSGLRYHNGQRIEIDRWYQV